MITFKSDYKKKETGWFREKEVEMLWDNVGRVPGVDILLVAIYTGMRIGELVTLNRRHINLKKRIIKHGSKTKAGKGRRIPIHSRILPIIEQYYDSADDNFGWLFIDSDVPFDDYTEMSERGQKAFIAKYRNRFENNIFSPVINAFEFADKAILTPHKTRHTFETRMRNAGARQDAINVIVGHADGHISDLYTHFTDEQLIAEVEKLK